MHKLSSSFILGYHGCDKTIAEDLLAGDAFHESQNDYDWLGPGIYVWEANPQRGMDFAREQAARRESNVEVPAVVGVVVELGLCLDLTSSVGIDQVRSAHEQLTRLSQKAGNPLPGNSANLMKRRLDCAVIRVLHEIRERAGEPPVDTVKGVFVEGGADIPRLWVL